MKIINPLSPTDQKEDIATVLYALAGQNGCDGMPYDQLQMAADYIRELEKKIMKAEERKGRIMEPKEFLAEKKIEQVQSTASRLYDLAIEIANFAEIVEDNTFAILHPIMRPSLDEEIQEEATEEPWPSYFHTLRMTLLKIQRHLDNIHRAILRVDL